MTSKAQAAMEFLLNYGWAILAVIIVIGALTYFGVLNPSNLASERCALSLPLKCLSQAAGDDGLIVTLQNTGNRDITLTSINMQSDALQGACMGVLNPTLTLRQGEKKTVTVSQGCSYQSSSKTKSKYALSINYQPEGTTINLVSQGDAVVTRQTGTSIEQMCTDAGSECQTGQGAFSYGSCKALHDANPSLSTGVYTLSFGSVYCDMTTDGGGWTLGAVCKASEASNCWTTAAKGSATNPNSPTSVKLSDTNIIAVLNSGEKTTRAWWRQKYRYTVLDPKTMALFNNYDNPNSWDSVGCGTAGKGFRIKYASVNDDTANIVPISADAYDNAWSATIFSLGTGCSCAVEGWSNIQKDSCGLATWYASCEVGPSMSHQCSSGPERADIVVWLR